MEEKKDQRLSLQERIIIETLLEEKGSKTYIATRLKRSRSTITREINIWVKKPTDKYNGDLALGMLLKRIRANAQRIKLDTPRHLNCKFILG
jgi:IS30 family transposase